jgi:hypothetical protein
MYLAQTAIFVVVYLFDIYALPQQANTAVVGYCKCQIIPHLVRDPKKYIKEDVFFPSTKHTVVQLSVFGI